MVRHNERSIQKKVIIAMDKLCNFGIDDNVRWNISNTAIRISGETGSIDPLIQYRLVCSRSCRSYIKFWAWFWFTFMED